MTQQINLFNPAFRRRRIALTLSRVVIGAALAVAGMGGLWFYETQVVKGLRDELRSTQHLLAVQRAHVEKVKKQATVAAGKPSQFDMDIARLERELKQAQEQIAAIQGRAEGRMQGFSEYLRAFSRQSLDGLWLTGFDIAGDGSIAIRGRILEPALVAGYIQRLNREEVLQGRNFAALEVRRPALPAAKGAPAGQASRFLEFRLATAEGTPEAPGAGGGRKP